MKGKLRFFIVYAVLAALGLLCGGYILIQQRVSNPFQNVYHINALFTAADGVVAGEGQPVNVAGVKEGTVVGSRLSNGLGLVTLQIDRSAVPHIYSNAGATIEPITPLDDMEINLDPGGPPARVLSNGATISVSQTTSPVPVEDLLSKLDANTRNYLSTTLVSLAEGTHGAAPDLRKMFVALGPTIFQAGQITRALAKRRVALAGFVHNLALVTRAASRDHQLASVVTAGNSTLSAMSQQDASLRQALDSLPSTLAATQSTLIQAKPFAHTLGPTLTALLPAVRRLPVTLRKLRPFADTGTAVLQKELRPLVKNVQPLLNKLSPAVTNLFGVVPKVTQALQATNYFLNVLGYHPPGDGGGGLFWLAWFAHNWNSLFGTVDAHGGIGRAEVLFSCKTIADVKSLQSTLDIAKLCPQ